MSQLIKGCSVLSGPPNLISFSYVRWRKGRGITEFMSFSALPSLVRTQQFLLKMQSSSSTCRSVLLWAWSGCCSWTAHFVTFRLPLTVSKPQHCIMIACHWTGLSAQEERLLHFNRHTIMTTPLAQTPNKVLLNTIGTQNENTQTAQPCQNIFYINILYEAWMGRIRGSRKCVLTVPSPAWVNQPVYKWLKWKET